MAEFVFYHSTMGSGKSTAALQLNYSLKQSGFKPVLIKPALDTRNIGIVSSRIGLSHACELINDNNIDAVFDLIYNAGATHIICDEAQFLNRGQVEMLSNMVDMGNIPVYCFGLRTAYTGELFEGAAALMAIADTLIDMPLMYRDGNKAVMHVRYINGVPIFEGDPIFVGDIIDEYESVSRKEYFFLKNHSQSYD